MLQTVGHLKNIARRRIEGQKGGSISPRISHPACWVAEFAEYFAGRRVISYGYIGVSLSMRAVGVSCRCGLIFSLPIFLASNTLSSLLQWWGLHDMAAVYKYCMVIAVAVSAIFLSSQQADAQWVMHVLSYQDYQDNPLWQLLRAWILLSYCYIHSTTDTASDLLRVTASVEA